MILIIDDDKAVRTSLTLLLKQEGYATKTAGDPTEAKQVLQSNTPELIIMDINFSIETTGVEGLALLKEIKALNAAIPVILITEQVGRVSL